MSEYINPIQTKKVSALPNFFDYYNVDEDLNYGGELTKNNLINPMDNAYLLIAYPGAELVPHNYKLALNDLGKLLITALNNRVKTVEKKIQDLEDLLSYAKNDDGKYNKAMVTNYWLLAKEDFEDFINTAEYFYDSNKIEQIREHWYRVNDLAGVYWNEETIEE